MNVGSAMGDQLGSHARHQRAPLRHSLQQGAALQIRALASVIFVLDRPIHSQPPDGTGREALRHRRSW
jgi:hypothetical protein